MAKTTVSNVNSKKKPARKVHWVPINEDLADELETVQGQLAEMRQSVTISGGSEFFTKQVEDLEAKEAELQAELRKPNNSLKFVFQSIGPKRYDKLVTQSQLTEERKAAIIAGGDDPEQMSFDVRLFSPKLIAASCIEPEDITEDYVRDEILDGENWTSGEVTDLYGAALEVNLRQRNVRLGNGSAQTSS